MEIATGIEREMPAPPPERARAPPKKARKKMVKAGTKPAGKKKRVFPGGVKVGIAVPPETARRLRQYRAQLEARGGDRITMAEAVDKAIRAAMAR
jgi:hypothetical protein